MYLSLCTRHCTRLWQTELQRLMPDGRVFLHLSRYLLHPTNRIWLQITRFYDAYLSHHSRLVGIQVGTTSPHIVTRSRGYSDARLGLC